MTDARLRRGRRALTLSFLVRGTALALLATRVPAVQRQYGVPDPLPPAYPAGVPVLAGPGGAATGALVRRVPAHAVLRWARPLVLLALAAVGAGERTWQMAGAPGLFELAAGAAVARLNVFTYGGLLVGSPLVDALGEVRSPHGTVVAAGAPARGAPVRRVLRGARRPIRWRS